LALLDDDNLLAPAMTKTELGVIRIPSLEERAQSDKPIILIVVSAKGMELARAAEDLSKWTAGVVWIRRPVPMKLDELPIETSRKGNVTIVSAERNVFEDFADAPAAQLNLLRCIRRILKSPEPSL
jgi:hypothetical protein